ncbi:MAG TPA: protein phosphatase 2C domain-containing protein [Burkholderiaceae bacterium]
MSQYKIAAITGQHAGSEALQQDRVALLAGERAPGYMMAVVADGAGGPKGGTLAAEQVIQTARQLFSEFSPVEKGAPPPPLPGAKPPVHYASNADKLDAMIRTIAQEAHQAIQFGRTVGEDPAHSAMAVLVLMPDGGAVWGHVGDARIYRFAGGALAEKTGDAAYVAELLRDGKVPPDAAKNHRRVPALLNALGNPQRAPFVTTGACSGLHVGDAFMVCTPGLWRYFSGEEMAAAVAKAAPREVSEKLIEKAGIRAQGKGENCTFAIVSLQTADSKAKAVAGLAR